MTSKKLIAVVGATGAQGGGLVNAILAHRDGPFAVRAITRNPSSDKSKALAKRGAEVVQADLDNVDSLSAAFAGCHGVFALTNFWEHFSGEKEKNQARNIAAATKAAGVKHVIWSTLEDTRAKLPITDTRMPVLQEHYNVPHFDAKGEADQYFRDAGVPTTFLVTCFYWDNFIHFGAGPQRGEDGVLGLTMPMGNAKLPAIAVADIGKAAYGIFEAGDKYVGKTIGIMGGALTGAEMAASLSKALGEEVRYNDVPADVFRSFPFPGADEMGNMYQYKRDFNESYVAARSIALAKELNPELQSFEAWLKDNAASIPV